MWGHSHNRSCTPALSATDESAGSWGRTQLLTDCWNNYRDVFALTLNAMVLGDVDNSRSTKNCMCALGLRFQLKQYRREHAAKLESSSFFSLSSTYGAGYSEPYAVHCTLSGLGAPTLGQESRPGLGLRPTLPEVFRGTNSCSYSTVGWHHCRRKPHRTHHSQFF
jgi:hypothetical protein